MPNKNEELNLISKVEHVLGHVYEKDIFHELFYIHGYILPYTFQFYLFTSNVTSPQYIRYLYHSV